VTGPRIGLALGSGSARGWSHIGVIEALVEAGVEPDVVCGASIGALVGAAYCSGKLDKLAKWAKAITWRQVLGLMDVGMSGGGLIDGKPLIKALRSLGVTGTIEDLERPFAAVATDLATGREVWFRSGPVLDAVRASIAIPGIFSPVRHAGQWLLDGGLVNPVPVSLCRALGADVIIAVNINGDQLGRWKKDEPVAAAHPRERPSRESFTRTLAQLPAALGDQIMQIAPRLMAQHGAPGYFDVLTGAIDIMQDHITRARLAGEPPHVMLMPRLRGIGLMDYHRAAAAIEEGHAAVADALPAIRRYL
jgi:NTE family protein